MKFDKGIRGVLLFNYIFLEINFNLLVFNVGSRVVGEFEMFLFYDKN